ncbi:B12-binding domain-containing protein [Pseudomonadota bacterium]
MGDMDEGFERALLALDRVAARNILMPISENKGAMEAVESLVVPVLKKLGEGWEGGGLSLAQIYMSGRICEELIDGLLPPADPLHQDTVQNTSPSAQTAL